jgi:hypothetical protein
MRSSCSRRVQRVPGLVVVVLLLLLCGLRMPRGSQQGATAAARPTCGWRCSSA